MKKLFLFLSFFNFISLLALFVSVPRPALAADPANSCDINTTVINQNTVSRYQSLASLGWGSGGGNSQSDCGKMSAKISSTPGFLRFEYCSATEFYTGDSSKDLQQNAGCYPVLLDSNGKYLAETENKSISLSNVAAKCPDPNCKITNDGRCVGPTGCSSQQPVCTTTSFGQASVIPGTKNCTINALTAVGSLKGAPIHLCTPADGSCDTALGMIPLDPGSLVVFLLKFLLGISGAVILIMLFIAGYNVATSAGDPQKLAGAKEMLISVGSGTVLIVFALVLLRAIGVDILQLPPLINMNSFVDNTVGGVREY